MATFSRVILPDGLQRPSLTAGTLDVVTRVYRSDVSNRRGAEITHLLEDGSIDVDADRALRGTCTLSVNDPSVLPPWAWSAVHIDVTPESQPTVSNQVGLFRMGQPEGTIREGWSPATIPGEDMTVKLQSFRFRDTYNISGLFTLNTDLGLLLLNAGITRYRLPATDQRLYRPRSFPPGAAAWEIVTFLCTTAGWRTPVAIGDGTLVVRELPGRAASEPVRRYEVGQDARIIGDIRRSRNDTNFANLVIVTSEGPGREPLLAVAENRNPNSVNSTVHPDGPGIVAAPPISKNDITSPLVLELLAIAELWRRNITEALTLELMPDHALATFDVVDLNVPPGLEPTRNVIWDGQGSPAMQNHMQPVSGLWEVHGISYGLQPRDSMMTVKVRRSEIDA